MASLIAITHMFIYIASCQQAIGTVAGVIAWKMNGTKQEGKFFGM